MRFTLTIRARTFAKPARLLFLLGACTGALLAACDLNSTFDEVSHLLQQRQYEAAAKLLDEVRACPGHSPLEKFQLGWLYGRARQYEKALSIFDGLPRDVPDPLTHDYAAALSRFELGQYQKAIALLKPDRASGLVDSKSINLLAVSYSKLGLYTEAYAVLSQQLQRNNRDLPTYLNLITVCAEGGDLAKAGAVAADARKQFPQSADVPILQGAINEQLGRSDQALADFSSAAALAPSRGDARFFMALVEYKRGRFDAALSVLHNAERDGIADSDLYYLAAECLLKLQPENRDAALAELNRAINLNSESVSARTLRGKLLLDAGRASEASGDLETAHKLDPASRTALYNLARAYRAVGRASEAQALFSQLRRTAPDTVNEFADSRLNGVLSGTDSQ
jgi:tetratricopeptide (TPR) repeat protein